MNEANKLAQELSDRKKEFKAAMFGNKLASFFASPSIGETFLLGELVFTDIQLPFKSLDIAELQPVDIRVPYDFLLPLENGERIVAFWHHGGDYISRTLLSCFDWLGRLICTKDLDRHVKQQEVAQCAPDQFIMSYDYNPSKLCVYNSSLHLVRSVAACRKYSAICCSSKFVFGLFESHSFSDDQSDEWTTGVDCSIRRIHAHHWDTELSEAFILDVAEEQYSIEQLIADENHVMAICGFSTSQRESSPQWFVSAFDLQAICEEDSSGGKKAFKFYLSERPVHLSLHERFLPTVFCLDGWLVFHHLEQIEWFDKEGNRSETITKLGSKNLNKIFASGSSFILTQHDGKLMLKR